MRLIISKQVLKVFVSIIDRTGGPWEYIERIFEDLKTDYLNNDDSVIFAVFHTKSSFTYTIDNSSVQHVYDWEREEHFTVE